MSPNTGVLVDDAQIENNYDSHDRATEKLIEKVVTLISDDVKDIFVTKNV